MQIKYQVFSQILKNMQIYQCNICITEMVRTTLIKVQGWVYSLYIFQFLLDYIVTMKIPASLYCSLH